MRVAELMEKLVKLDPELPVIVNVMQDYDVYTVEASSVEVVHRTEKNGDFSIPIPPLNHLAKPCVVIE